MRFGVFSIDVFEELKKKPTFSLLNSNALAKDVPVGLFNYSFSYDVLKIALAILDSPNGFSSILNIFHLKTFKMDT